MIKTPPRIIAIEGIDGSGKGTQARLLLEKLTTIGHSASIISFPDYGLQTGKLIASYLNGGYGDIDAAPVIPISLLYSLNRAERQTELRSGKQGHTIILDRYTGSNLAHQGAKLPAEEFNGYVELMMHMEHTVLHLPRADVTIFLDVDENQSHANVAVKGDRAYTAEKHDLHESNLPYLAKVRTTYRLLADRYGWRRVDCSNGGGMRAPADIAHEVFSRMYF